jgi:predicted Zn-dependent protease
MTNSGENSRMDKIAMLKEILAQNPADAFARYGLAMEYSGRGELDAALAEFDRLGQDHPDYAAGYFMAAQMLAKARRNNEAKARLRKGVEAARRSGNQHAQSEMQTLLDELEFED